MDDSDTETAPMLCLFLIPAAVCHGADTLRLPGIFTDHLVLQRDRPVAVWSLLTCREFVTNH